jgi:4-hydroxy-tetrahydrodipicolinate reductase
MIDVIIHGHSGKLGKRIIENLREQDNMKYAGYIDRNYDLTIINDINQVVIIDITSDIGCKNLIENLIMKNLYVPLIIGSTGDLPNDLIEKYSEYTKVATISNFSYGISSLLNMLSEIKLPDSKIQIKEYHHINKIDAPSGTAKTISKKINFNDSEIISIREGTIYGIHEIIIENMYEKIIIKHEVKDPNIFAIGCISYITKILELNVGLYCN